MPDEEWIKTPQDGRKVKFIYKELPEDGAFITAQLAGNEVVYSVLLTTARNPLSREDALAEIASRRLRVLRLEKNEVGDRTPPYFVHQRPDGQCRPADDMLGRLDPRVRPVPRWSQRDRSI